ncbi:hypothetical protein KM043_000097 [Ampulex compressa]|nr:hypothetical protein KM043_000097 [Ampulex compressa]
MCVSAMIPGLSSNLGTHLFGLSLGALPELLGDGDRVGLGNVPVLDFTCGRLAVVGSREGLGCGVRTIDEDPLDFPPFLDLILDVPACGAWATESEVCGEVWDCGDAGGGDSTLGGVRVLLGISSSPTGEEDGVFLTHFGKENRLSEDDDFSVCFFLGVGFPDSVVALLLFVLYPPLGLTIRTGGFLDNASAF